MPSDGIIAASFEYHSTPQPTRRPCVARRDAFRIDLGRRL